VREVTNTLDDEIPEYHDMKESQEPPQIMISQKRKPAWERELIQYGEKYGSPEGTMRQIKKPKTLSNYMALMCDLIEKEPDFFE
jgi:hypothetical protein